MKYRLFEFQKFCQRIEHVCGCVNLTDSNKLSAPFSVRRPEISHILCRYARHLNWLKEICEILLIVSKYPSVSASPSSIKKCREILYEIRKSLYTIHVSLKSGKNWENKTITTLCLSVSLFACVSTWNKSAVTGRGFFLNISKICPEILLSLISENNWYFTCKPMYVHDTMSFNYF